MTARRLAGPAIMALVMMAVLIGLGVWQIRRLHWKQGILAAMDHAEASPPIPLPAHPGRFQKVAVTGTLRADLNVFYGADVRDTPTGPQMGAQLIQPLVRADGPPVLIDRGWVPDHVPIATPTGPVTLQGYVRPPDSPGRFTPSDDPPTRHFYTLDPAPMARSIGLTVAPFTLVVLGSSTAPPLPSAAMPRPPNDHLSYAITWFALAGVLAAMFAVWVRQGSAAARKAEQPVSLDTSP